MKVKRILAILLIMTVLSLATVSASDLEGNNTIDSSCDDSLALESPINHLSSDSSIIDNDISNDNSLILDGGIDDSMDDSMDDSIDDNTAPDTFEGLQLCTCSVSKSSVLTAPSEYKDSESNHSLSKLDSNLKQGFASDCLNGNQSENHAICKNYLNCPACGVELTLTDNLVASYSNGDRPISEAIYSNGNGPISEAIYSNGNGSISEAIYSNGNGSISEAIYWSDFNAIASDSDFSLTENVLPCNNCVDTNPISNNGLLVESKILESNEDHTNSDSFREDLRLGKSGTVFIEVVKAMQNFVKFDGTRFNRDIYKLPVDFVFDQEIFAVSNSGDNDNGNVVFLKAKKSGSFNVINFYDHFLTKTVSIAIPKLDVHHVFANNSGSNSSSMTSWLFDDISDDGDSEEEAASDLEEDVLVSGEANAEDLSSCLDDALVTIFVVDELASDLDANVSISIFNSYILANDHSISKECHVSIAKQLLIHKCIFNQIPSDLDNNMLGSFFNDSIVNVYTVLSCILTCEEFSFCDFEGSDFCFDCIFAVEENSFCDYCESIEELSASSVSIGCEDSNTYILDTCGGMLGSFNV